MLFSLENKTESACQSKSDVGVFMYARMYRDNYGKYNGGCN